jgi:hypothetical protein
MTRPGTLKSEISNLHSEILGLPHPTRPNPRRPPLISERVILFYFPSSIVRPHTLPELRSPAFAPLLLFEPIHPKTPTRVSHISPVVAPLFLTTQKRAPTPAHDNPIA